MLETLILLAAFTTLIVVGVHSVTRVDKVLWWAAARIHSIDKIIDLEAQMNEKLDAAFYSFESKIETKELELQALSESKSENGYFKSEKEIADLRACEFANISEIHEIEKQLIQNFFGQKTAALQSRADKLKRNRFIKLLLFFAPALTECLTCMASFWGLLISTLHFSGVLYLSLFSIPIVMPFFILSVAGLNTIIGKMTA